MPGIIETNLANNQKVYGAETEDYDPTTREVDAGTETVAGQLHTLLSSGSPYLERAKAGARESANRRGLLNSSMAAGAGEAAAIDAALPIAQSDANTYTTKSRDNQGFQNTASQFNAGAKNTSNLQAAAAANQSQLTSQQGEQQRQNIGAQAEAERGLIGSRTDAESRLQSERGEQAMALQSLQGEQATGLQTLKGQQDTALQTLRGEQAERVAQIEVASRGLLQASAASTAIYNGMIKSINDIMANPEIAGPNKQAAIDRNIDWLESSLAVIGGIADLDLGSLLSFDQP